MAATAPTLARTVLTHGLGFGLIMTLYFWVRDAIEGRVPPWPRWALGYVFTAVLSGILYGCFYWWLERRSARRL